MTAVISADGIGYGIGSGGAVTQLTSKSTAVTLNKPTGQITMNNAALAAGADVVFVLNNSSLSITDALIVNSTNLNYRVIATVGPGSSVIRVSNLTGGSLSEALIINFAIIKGATS